MARCFAVLSLWLVLQLCAGGCSDSAPGNGNEHRPAAAPPVEFNARVDTATTAVGDRITLTLSLSSEPQIAVQLPEAGSRITGLRIVDTGEEGPKLIDNRTVQKKWYVLQPDTAGSYIIPAFSVTYTAAGAAPQELKSAQLFIEVTAGPNNMQGAAGGTIRDIKPPQAVPWTPGKALICGALIAVLLVACGGLFYYYAGKKKNPPPAPPRPAHILALEELEQLTREQLLERGIVQEYYFRLSEIFRRYLERRFHIPAVERTTEEIMPDIVNLQACPAVLKDEVREILRYADLVKFARFCPDWKTSANDFQRVVRVIEETKEAPHAVEAAHPCEPSQ